jgi:lipoate---protein ligase
VTFAVEHATDTAAALHAWEPDAAAGRVVRVARVTAPAVVLGSVQPDTVDRDVAHTLGASVVRRRSGGGAVWVAPDDPVWVDVVIPAGDPLWHDDVGRSFGWLGACWAGVLDACGVVGATVHEGVMIRSPMARLVCFAGRGPGEVTIGDRKVVGLAQRRTRALAWFQCAVPRIWDPGPLAAVLGLEAPDIASVALGVGQSVELIPRLLDRLQAISTTS